MKWHVSELWQQIIVGSSWLLAAAWVHRVANQVWNMPSVPDLTTLDWDMAPARAAKLAVIVPAKDEAEHIEATLESLRLQEYPHVRVIAVDDRSTDRTGEIAEAYARKHPERFEAIHIQDLPAGWLGKTWAMDVALRLTSEAEYVLFADADVQFSPSVLRRALAFAESSEADHLIVYPTPVTHSRGEAIVMAFLQMLSLWAVRPWKIPDPQARHDVLGVGAFNLVRRAAFEEIGGFFPQRMVVIEDVTVARRMKAAGMNMRVALAPGLVLIHWATGIRGIVRVTTKNLFSSVNFRPFVLLAGCAGLLWGFLAPLALLVWPPTILPSVLTLLAIFVAYREFGNVSSLEEKNFFAYPVGLAVLVWAMLWSMSVVLVRGGVTWRGTFYELAELRLQNSPFRWEKEAAELRYRSRRESPGRLRQWLNQRRPRS